MGFAIAVALGKLGQFNPAWNWYVRAAEWSASNKTETQLRGLWAEAAAVLGIETLPPPRPAGWTN